MNIEQNENLMENEYEESFRNTNENCYINSYPMNNYLNRGFSYNSNNNKDYNSNYYNVNNKSDIHFKNKKKHNKLCNLNDPKLLQAYNEGYYGKHNIPKQYYIYPKFSNIELNKKAYTTSEEKKSYSINNTLSSDLNNKDNNYDTIYNKVMQKNINNFKGFIPSYSNYPYPRLINISSNFFGQFHPSFKEGNLAISNNSNKINKNYENNEKENQNENILNEAFNKSFDISLNIKDNKNMKLKGKGKIIQNEIDNENEVPVKDNNINESNNLNETGTFYYINNNITKRTPPYNNMPDNISIDEEEGI